MVKNVLTVRPSLINRYLHPSLRRLPFTACNHLPVLKDNSAGPPVEKEQPSDRGGGLRRDRVEPRHHAARLIPSVTVDKRGDRRSLIRCPVNGHTSLTKLDARVAVCLDNRLKHRA